MPDDLYDRDILAWSEAQTSLLRRLASGERVNDAVDWFNVIEELEAVGRSELRACESLLEQALLHIMKWRRWPDSLAAPHWPSEILGFLAGARRAYAPSMHQRITLAELWSEARRRAEVSRDASGEGRPLPVACPLTLEDLLAPDADLAAFALRLSS